MKNGKYYNITSFDKNNKSEINIINGKYSINQFINEINMQINNINPNISNMFIYNDITKKIKFKSEFTGNKDDIINNLPILSLMGYTYGDIPEFIEKGDIIESNKLIDGFKPLNNLYIKSKKIGSLQKENTLYPLSNNDFSNIIGTLTYDTNSDIYKLSDSNKSEIFLSHKINIDEIDIKIVDKNNELVNLNDNRVIIHINLVKS